MKLRCLLLTGICFVLCFPLQAQNYLDYHRAVSGSISLAAEGQYKDAAQVLETTFQSFAPFAEEYVLAAHYYSELKDEANFRKYISLLQQSNIDRRIIRNRKIKKALEQLPMQAFSSPEQQMIDSVFKIDQEARTRFWGTPQAQAMDSANFVFIRFLITQDRLPSERALHKTMGMSVYRGLLAHFPSSDYDFYRAHMIHLVGTGILRPHTVAGILDYRNPQKQQWDSLGYGYDADIYAAKLRTIKIRAPYLNKDFVRMMQLSKNVQKNREEIGMPKSETLIRQLQFLDKNGLYLL